MPKHQQKPHTPRPTAQMIMAYPHLLVISQNYHVALEQLEKLQHERSLHMETPAGELREQVNSLSNTVELLTSLNKVLEEKSADASQTIKQLEGDKTKLKYAYKWRLCACTSVCAARQSVLCCRTKLQEQDTTIQDHTQEMFMLQKQLSDLRTELSRLQAVQPAASVGADKAVSQQGFLSQMDDLESAYQKQLADLESQLDGVKAENLILCMELQDVGKEAQKESQMVYSDTAFAHSSTTLKDCKLRSCCEF